MKDTQIQSTLAKVMVIGTLTAAAIIGVGLIWFMTAHAGIPPGDQIFNKEPKYFENPISMVRRALDWHALGERRSVIMIGVVLLLINPVIRVAFALFGFAAQKDRLYTVISAIVFGVLLISFFW